MEEPRERDPLADDPLREVFVWWDTISRSNTDQLERVLDDERLRRELGARARCRIQERSPLEVVEVVGGQLRQCMTSTSAFHATR